MIFHNSSAKFSFVSHKKKCMDFLLMNQNFEFLIFNVSNLSNCMYLKPFFSTFFGLTTRLTESLVPCFIVNSNFNASPALNLQVKSTPETAKFVGSNLTRNFFFKTGLENMFSKHVGLLFVCFCFVDLVSTA